jgi:hypothetical protein
MKKPSRKARGKALRLKPFENNKVDFSKFKMEPSASDIAKQAWAAAGAKVWPVNPPIQVLSPAKTVGLGRTNISLEGAYVRFRTDATTPYAALAHPAAVQVNFEPIAYGITSAETYVITFNISSSKAAFTLSHSGDPPLAGILWSLGVC